MTKSEWAESFKEENHECSKCPFVKNEADVGVGIIYDCDRVCMMEVLEIVKYIDELDGE